MTLLDVAPAHAGEWLSHPGFGVYVHIPFCRHRCHYCDFNTYEGQDDLHAAYVDALAREVQQCSLDTRVVSSIFFGGGTPTLLPVPHLRRLLSAIKERFQVASDAEITIEANPETVEEASFEALLEAGFNRFSIGIQSLAPGVLAQLGRRHDSETALAALHAARRAGVENLNADLIYGSPWESAQDWHSTLESVVELGPEHLSAYALTIEEGTPLATLVATGRAPDVDPDVQADRYHAASGLLSRAGYDRYEVSNWARPGYASAHNTLYWSAGDYAGFGAGAHGHTGGSRWWNLRLPRVFISAVDAGGSTRAGEEYLGDGERAGEALVLGLRLTRGVDLERFAARFGAAHLEQRGETLASLEAAGLVERAAGRLRLSDRATLVASDVSCRLL
jgi:putative oxygen-independent coproporphyrinogen III oxidase